MSSVGEYLNSPKMLQQQVAQTRAGEKILVIAFEEMPGHHRVTMQIRDQFDVRDGDNKPSTSNSSNFAEEGGWLRDVFEYFDADCGVERTIRKGQRLSVDLYMR